MLKMVIYNNICTINSQINGTPKGVYLPISKLRLKSSVIKFEMGKYKDLWWYHLFYC